jgi:hypothetical protein
MRKVILSLFLLQTLSALSVFSQIFIDDLRRMPVLIQIPLQDGIHSEFGTGMLLETSNKIYFVTAAHCIFDMSSTNRSQLINSIAILSSLSRSTNENDRAVQSLNLALLEQNGHIKRHAVHDITVIELATKVGTNTTEFQHNPGILRLTPGVNPVPWSVEDACKTFKDVPEGCDSYVLGYPVSLMLEQQSEIDFTSPLIRKGVISQKNNFTKRLIIDSAVYGGNSGGPVLIVEQPRFGVTQFSIVGIITQYVPVEATVDVSTSTSHSALIKVNSGYGVAEPIDYAIELMNQFP